MKKDIYYWGFSFLLHFSILYVGYLFIEEESFIKNHQEQKYYECTFGLDGDTVVKMYSPKKKSIHYTEKAPSTEIQDPPVSEFISVSDEKENPFVAEKVQIPKTRTFLDERLTTQKFDIRKVQQDLSTNSSQNKEHTLVQDISNTKKNSVKNNDELQKEESADITQREENVNVTHITPPKLKNKIKIKFPQVAKRTNLSGKVLLHVQVLLDGTIGEINILKSSSHKVLDRAAIDSVKMLLFSPALRNNFPVTSWIKIPINFKKKK